MSYHGVPCLSPDMNPIEHLWDELGRRVSRRDNQPINRETLIAALQEEWNNVPHSGGIAKT